MFYVVGSSTQPTLGAVRLAWWRDSLERLDRGPPPPEPRLQACARELLPRGVSGERLGAIADGYAALFDEVPDLSQIAAGGAALFESASRLLGSSDPLVGRAGGLHSIARTRRLGLLAARAEPDPSLLGHRFPKKLRPLTGLTRLGARDLGRGNDVEPEATPARAAALLAHRLTGAIA